MAIYFTISKSPHEFLTVTLAADGFKRAVGYKRGLVLDCAYREDQITISGKDSNGLPVKA
jgi:hypothetical protein